MDAVDLLKRLHQHRAWTNSNLLNTARELSDQQLHTSFPIGQGSIWKSLVHLYAAEFVWLEALSGNDEAVVDGDLPGKLPGNQLGDGGIAGLEDLSQKWQEQEQRWEGYLALLTPDALDEIVNRKVSSTGARFGTRRSDVLLHVCTHAQYTTAQVTNMLRRTGLEKLPDVMLVSMARQEAKP